MMSVSPKGKQIEVLALPTHGHYVVLGTAGSGKTTIALLRARHLSSLPGKDKVLLVTFNKALVHYMRYIDGSDSTKLRVENYHTWARGYLNSRGKMPTWNGILNTEGKEALIKQALSILKSKNPAESTLKRPEQFFIEEIRFIQQFGFASFDEYREAERIGRSKAFLTRENRKWVYEVYSLYLRLRQEQGQKYDWDDLALYAYYELKEDHTERLYTHIIIDEGQDFSPMMIRSLTEEVRAGGSFTFFGDVAQQIYGNRLSWRDSGIDTSKIWRFDINYRNPATIMAFANDITGSTFWQHSDDMVTAVSQIAKGPNPILLRFSSRQEETKWIVKRAVTTGKLSSTVIICRNRADIDCLIAELERLNCHAIEINKDTAGFPDQKKVYLTTYHSAKGLEFENVFIPYLSQEKIPDPEMLSKAETEGECYSNELKLFYVAVTRCKNALYMSYSGTLSPIFPAKSIHYDSKDMEAI